MAESDLTTLSSSFTGAVADIKAPVLAILGACVVIPIIFTAYKLLKGGFKKGTSA